MIKRRGFLILVSFLAVPALVAPLAWPQELEPTGSEMAHMRDGVRLATDYYLPADSEGPFPVVLARSTYGRGQPWNGVAERLNARGIAFVIQDTRGRGGSEGEDMVFSDDGWGERQDGLDTVNWIRAQPWCNGKIGTWGGSALGITELLLAGAGADVQAQYVVAAPSEFYGQITYQGGVFRKELAEDWVTRQGSAHMLPIWKDHPEYDAYWQDHFNITARAPNVTAPGVHVNGWFDIFAQGTIDTFLARQYHGGDGARGNQLLIMGPWPHGAAQQVGELTFPDNYSYPVRELQEELFDYWLLGEDTGIAEAPRVRYYTIGAIGEAEAPGNEWRTADTWPPFEAEETRLYLSADGALTLDTSNRTDGPLTYSYDPADPVPTLGGANLFHPPGPFDQRGLGERKDILKFATAPLERPVEITGRVRVELYVSSTAPDTDFTAKLLDIYPDGREMLMLDSIQRLKFRNGFETADPLTPGEVGKVVIDLWSISLIFNEGHRIGVHVSSSNYPRFEVNPNSGGDFPAEDNLRTAENTVYMSETHPSALVIPLRPED